MFARLGLLGAVVALLAAGAGLVQAGENFRLALHLTAPPEVSGSDLQRLDLKEDDADTTLVRGRGYGGGGYRGSYGGYRNYYGGYRNYYGGYRNYYGGYRNYYGGYGGYRNYYGGYGGYYGGYRNYYYPQYYYNPGYYSSPGYSFGYSYYSTPSYYNCPMGLEIGTQPAPQVLNLPPPQTDYRQQAPRQDGTYPYDGGPQNPVPMPGAEPAAPKAPPATVPPSGRIVSLNQKPVRYTYAAYGEEPERKTTPPDRTILVGAKKSGR